MVTVIKYGNVYYTVGTQVIILYKLDTLLQATLYIIHTGTCICKLVKRIQYHSMQVTV